MKEMIKQYKEEVKQLVCHKRYFLAMIIVSILSYGFAITNYSVGVYDLCFDRYIKLNIYIVSKKMGNMGII